MYWKGRELEKVTKFKYLDFTFKKEVCKKVNIAVAQLWRIG